MSSSGYVFLTECNDFAHAQVIKSYLESQNFHPKVRDEQMRTVAPHLQQLLGKLIIEIPQHEFFQASSALETLEATHRLQVVEDTSEAESKLTYTQNLAKKCLANAVIGCIFIPILCGLYSMILGYRVLVQERPLSKLSRRRLWIAIVFNSFGFYVWLGILSKYLHR